MLIFGLRGYWKAARRHCRRRPRPLPRTTPLPRSSPRTRRRRDRRLLCGGQGRGRGQATATRWMLSSPVPLAPLDDPQATDDAVASTPGFSVRPGTNSPQRVSRSTSGCGSMPAGEPMRGRAVRQYVRHRPFWRATGLGIRGRSDLQKHRPQPVPPQLLSRRAGRFAGISSPSG